MIFNSVKDRSNWIDTISKLPIDYQDIYFHPDYVTLNCFKNNSKGFLFCNIEMDKIWVNPFIKIKVPSFNNLLGEVYFDLETPYGYGGPISNSTDQNFILRSNLKFSKWVKSNNIISEFVRFHPLFDTKIYTDSNFEILGNRITCSLDLKQVNQNISPFKSKVKNIIRNAYKNTKVYISRDKKDFSYFKKFYLNLMIEKNAEKETFFSSTYFNKLYKLINENGFMSVAKNKKLEIIAVGIFLNGKKSTHYHLSASKNYDYPGVNNLLIFEAALHSKKHNLEFMHLGGGNIDNKEDKLFKFKNSMSTNHHKYYIGKRINNIQIYMKLKKAWKEKYPILYEKYSDRLLCYHLDTEIVNTIF